MQELKSENTSNSIDNSVAYRAMHPSSTRNSEDRIDNLSAEGSSSPKNSSIAQLLAKLLCILLSLRRWTGSTRLIGNSHGWNAAIVRIAWAWRRKCLSLLARIVAITTGLLVAIGILSDGRSRALFDLNVVDRENTLLASSHVLAQPPIGVHVFEDRDVVANLESAVLWLIVAVESDCSCNLGLRGGLAGGATGERRRGGCVVCGWRRFVVDSHVVECIGRDSRSAAIATSGAVEGGFGRKSPHDGIVDLITDGSMLSETFKLLDRC